MPTSLPALETDIAGSDSTATRDHADIHNDVAAEVNAIGAKVGVDGSADTASLDYLVKAGANPGHTHTAYLGAAAAAGGDLSGNYPNPSVVDDSHGHSGATLTGVVKSGDAAGGDLGSTYPNPTIGANKVTDAMLRQSAALSLVGRSANSTGNVADIAAASDGQVMRRSGTSIGFGDISESAITDGSLLARVAGSETITGTWTFNAGTFLDKGSEVYNVKAYGAVGDNSTDDTTAIQSAITAAVAAKGVVFFPAGTYKITTALQVTGDGVMLAGAGPAASVINVASAAINGVVFSDGTVHYRNAIRDIGFTSSVTKNAGSAIDLNYVQQFDCRNVYIEKQFTGITIEQLCSIVYIDSVQIRDTIASTGIGIDCKGDSTHTTGDIYLSKIVMDNVVTAQPLAGIRLLHSGGMIVSQCEIIHCGINLFINPGSSQYVWWCTFSDCFFDTSNVNSVKITTSNAAGSVLGLNFNNCWISGADEDGLLIDATASSTVQGLRFNSCRIFYNGKNGVKVNSSIPTDMSWDNCDVANNSRLAGTANAAVSTTNTTLTDTRLALTTNAWAGAVITCNGKTMTVTSNTATTFTGASWSGGSNPGNGNAWSDTGSYNGFTFATSSSHWEIRGCRIGENYALAYVTQTQGWGVVLNGSNDYFQILHNDFRIGTVGYLFDTNTGSYRKIQNNINVNPYGKFASQPAVPASTVGQTNTYGVDATVYVAGGTVSAIAVAGNATGLTTGAIRVPAGSSIVLTYTVAPTWVWFGD